MLADLGPGEIVLTHRNGLLVYAEGEFYEVGFFPAELAGRSGWGDFVAVDRFLVLCYDVATFPQERSDVRPGAV